jgi:hypothetical protein
MDVDGEEDGTQRALPVLDFGLVVDFDALDEDEREVSRIPRGVDISLT